MLQEPETAHQKMMAMHLEIDRVGARVERDAAMNFQCLILKPSPRASSYPVAVILLGVLTIATERPVIPGFQIEEHDRPPTNERASQLRQAPVCGARPEPDRAMIRAA